MAALRPFSLSIIVFVALWIASCESQGFRSDCFDLPCNRWVAPLGGSQPQNDTTKCGARPATPCHGMNNATWMPTKHEDTLVVCLLPGDYYPRQGPYVLPYGTKVCGADDPDNVIIHGDAKFSWDKSVFLLRDEDMWERGGNSGAKKDSYLESGLARMTFTNFNMKSFFGRTDVTDLIHVSGEHRKVTLENLVITSNEDIDDYLIDCRNNATCTLSNVNATLNHGGVLYATANASVTLIRSRVEKNLGRTQGAVRFENMNMGLILSSVFQENPLTALFYDGGNCYIDSSTFASNTAYDRGGAIRAVAGNLQISASNFNDNIAIKSSGGAIAATDMINVKIANSNFDRNTAETSCGAVDIGTVYASGQGGIIQRGSLEYSSFNRNRAKRGAGGAVCTRGIRIHSSTFVRNRAFTAGGAVIASNVTFVDFSTFSYNTAKELGGALYVDETPARTRPLIVDYCSFDHNQALDSGGAVFTEASVVVAHSYFNENNATYGGAMGTDGEMPLLRVINTTSYENSARIFGGAIYAAGLLTTVSVENSSLIGNWCDKNGGAIHLFAPFSPRSLRVSNTIFSGNWLLHDSGGADVALNSSVAIFDNTTILSVLISDWEESRDARAAANFSRCLFLDDPREFVSMQGAATTLSISNSTFLNQTDCPEDVTARREAFKRSVRLARRLGRRRSEFDEKTEPRDLTGGCAQVPIPYTFSRVTACPVGRYYRNQTQNCQICQQGQYNFNGGGGRCFDCPNRIACVELRNNIVYEVLKGYQPSTFKNPSRVLKCKMHMSGLEGDLSPHHSSDNSTDHHDSDAPSSEHHSSPADHQGNGPSNASLLFYYDETSFVDHIIRSAPLIKASTRHVVRRPATAIRLSSTPVSDGGDDDNGHGDDHGEEGEHHDDEDHSPCLPTSCHSICKPTFGNMSVAQCDVECGDRQCADGYEERMCAKCECLSREHCWYRSHHSCHKCRPPERLWPSIALLVTSLVVFTVFRRRLLKILFFFVTVTAVTLVVTRVGDRFLVSWILIAFIVFLEKVKTSSEGVLKSFIFWIQTTLTLINSFVWPPQVRGALEYLQLVEFSGWGLECYFPTAFSGELGKFLFILLLPVLLSVVLLLSVSGTTLLRKISFCKKLQTWDPLAFIPRFKWKSKKKSRLRRRLKKVFSKGDITDTDNEDPFAPLLDPPRLRPKPSLEDDHEGEFDDSPMFAAPRHHAKHAPSAGSGAFSFSSFHSTAGADINAKRDSLIHDDDGLSNDQSMRDLSAHFAKAEHSIQSEWERNSTNNPHAPKKRTFVEMITHGALFFLFVCHFEVSTSVFEILTPCEHADDGHYMVMYPWIKCITPLSFNTEYGQLMLTALIFGLFYAFGVVIFFGALLFLNRQRIIDGHTGVLNVIGFLYESYRTRYYWFELVWLVRRVLLAAAIGLLTEERILYPVAVSSILMISLLIQRHVKPFTSKLENFMEQLTICVLLFTLIASNVLESSRNMVTGNAEEDDVIKLYRTIIQWSIFGVNIVAFLCFMVGFFWRYIPCLKPIEYHRDEHHGGDATPEKTPKHH